MVMEEDPNSPPPTDTLVYNYIWDNFLLKKNLKAG